MFDFEKISASKFYTSPSVERVVEFSPPDIDMANVARVLSLGVDAKCIDVEISDGYAQVQGRTNFKVIYLDKEGAPKGVDYNADFSVRVEGDFCDGDNATCDINVVETDASASERLLLSSVLSVSVSVIRRDEKEMLVGADDCYKTLKEVYVPKFLATKTTTAPYDAEHNVGGEVSAVLSLSADCILTDAKIVGDTAVSKASVVAHITYVEGGEIKHLNFDIPLEDEFALDGVQDGDTVKIVPTIKSSKVILQGVTGDNVIRLEGEVQYKIWAFRCQKMSVVDNIFMLTNETSTTKNNVQYTCFDGCGFFTQTVSGNAVLGDTKSPAIEVSSLPYARCYTTRAAVDDAGKLQVEGIVNADIIYTDENGYNSVRAEIPFAIDLSSEKPFSQTVRTSCHVLSINARVRREREFEIEMVLLVEACGFSPVEFDYISQVDIGQERPQNNSCLSIYIASEGEDMLDVCKSLTAMPEDIIEQNPTLELPLKEGDRIIYFRRLA